MSPPDNPGRDRRQSDRDPPIHVHEGKVLPVPSGGPPWEVELSEEEAALLESIIKSGSARLQHKPKAIVVASREFIESVKGHPPQGDDLDPAGGDDYDPEEPTDVIQERVNAKADEPFTHPLDADLRKGGSE